MIRRASIFAACLLACGLIAQTRTDRSPSWDALLLASFDRGDASDRSYSDRTPTTSGGATFPAGYRTIDFDGTSNAAVAFPDADQLDTFPLTVMCWFRIDGDPVTGISLVSKCPAIYASPSNLYRGWILAYYQSPYRLAWSMHENTFSKYNSWYVAGSTAHDGVWRHVCIVQATVSGVPVYYLNGVAQSITYTGGGWPAQAATTVSNSETVKLAGKGFYEQSVYLNGALDDVRIYGRALSAAEIAAIYAEGLGVTRP